MSVATLSLSLGVWLIGTVLLVVLTARENRQLRRKNRDLQRYLDEYKRYFATRADRRAQELERELAELTGKPPAERRIRVLD